MTETKTRTPEEIKADQEQNHAFIDALGLERTDQDDLGAIKYVCPGCGNVNLERHGVFIGDTDIYELMLKGAEHTCPKCGQVNKYRIKVPKLEVVVEPAKA